MKLFKTLLNKITPRKIYKMLSYLHSYSKIKSEVNMFNDDSCFPFYKENYQRQRDYSNNPHQLDTPEKILSSIVIEFHAIEKGLTMSEMRLGFGEARIMGLVKLCNKYLDNYVDRPDRLKEAVYVLLEYLALHNENGYIVNDEIRNAIDSLAAHCCITEVRKKQTSASAEDYFRFSNSSFDLFSNSRHSAREFTGEQVAFDKVERAIKLAQNAPSTCNRQSCRVYIISNNILRQKAFALQSGNQGFSHNASLLLIITSDLQAWNWGEQWFGPYIDGGIYLMNLLYSLHFNEVAACPLNWYSSIDNNTELRKLINIPENEIIISFVACGIVKENFMLANSLRRDYLSIMKVLE